MKKKLLKTVFVCLITVVALSSCKKDDSNKNNDFVITAAVENGSNYNAQIDLVKVEIGNYEHDEAHELVTAEYKNGEFTVNLPEKVNSQYLESLDNASGGITSIDSKAKIGYAYFSAYKSNDIAGYLFCRSGEWDVIYVYVDEDVTRGGSIMLTHTTNGVIYTDITEYNVNLKQGWNIVYEKRTTDGNTTTKEITSTSPSSGAKWYFQSSEYGQDESGARTGTPLLSSK
jgi:hypothetical protein